MKVIVCGDRNWRDGRAIAKCLAQLPEGTLVINGGCRGADTMAKELAYKMGFSVNTLGALWARHGRAAGPIRNKEMLKKGPDLVIAFHNDLAKSKGTRGMVELALSHGVEVELWTEKGQADVLEVLGG